MHWVLQANLFQEQEWDTLVSCLKRMGLSHSVHKVVPFVGELVPAPQVKDAKVICMGSYSMRHAARQHGWSPGVYDLFDQDFLVQRKMWGDRMLNVDSQVVEFGHAKPQGPTFIRPVDDSKHFAGKVFDQEEFEAWQAQVLELGAELGTSLTPRTLIQLSPPARILCEARVWVVDGKCVTHSLYKRGRRVVYSPDVDDHLLAFAQKAVDDWAPHRAFVIDVCDTPEGPRIVEINTLNSAGFYAGDMQKLIVALEEIEAVR